MALVLSHEDGVRVFVVKAPEIQCFRRYWSLEFPVSQLAVSLSLYTRPSTRDATYCNGDESRTRKDGAGRGEERKANLPTFSIPFYFI
jgi:hypothetical protein